VEKPQIFRSPTAVVVWVVWLLFAVGNWVDLAVQGRDHLSVVAAAVLLLATGAAYVTAQRPRIIADDAGVTVRNPLRDHRIGWAGVAEVDLVDLLRVHCAWGGPPGAAPADREHHKVISAWAIHYSRRRQFAAEAKARRGARRSTSAFPVGFGRSYGSVAPAREPVSASQADAERIVKLLQARATAAHAEAVWADSPVETAAAHPAGGTQPAAGTDAAEPAPAAQSAPGTTAAPTAQAAPGTTAVAATGWAEPLTSTWSRRALAALLIPALILLVVVLI
jgi:PH (Pleckstrin Homology) domain-containing protein